MDEKNKTGTDGIAVLLDKWIGEILYCEKIGGKRFTARLVAVRGYHLFFVNRSGWLMMDSIDSLVAIRPLDRPKLTDEEIESMGQAYQDQLKAEVMIEAQETARRDEYESAARARKGL